MIFTLHKNPAFILASMLLAAAQLSCAGNTPEALETKFGKSTEVKERIDLTCGGKEFRLLRVSLEGGAEGISLFKGDDELRTERLPSQSEVSQFKLDPLRKTETGFELSAEYGTKYYHTKRFEFACEDSAFKLVKMRSERFDTNNPGKLLKKDSAVNPKIPFEEFGLRLYLID